MDLLSFRCILLLLLLYQLDECFTLDVTQCKQEWVPTNSGAYTYRVDCSNLGFRNIPVNLPELTSELLLNGNSISSVGDQAFAGLKSLHTLDLSGNDIATFNNSLFEKNTALKNLDISSNRLICDWKLWWLVTFAKKLDTFQGKCHSPRSLRDRDITSISKEDLTVDCISVKRLSDVVTDGDYSVRVFGQDNSYTQVTMYCAFMSGATPKEYLTLPSGGLNNFVSLSWKDTKCNINSDDELQEKIQDITEQEIISKFNRIRLEVDTLSIITSDTTFASNKIALYGRAGLCGNTVCISGKASIDLRGTKFQLKKSKQIEELSSCSNCESCNVTNRIDLELINAERMPYQACTLPLGLQNGFIPDSAITATSFAGKIYMPHHARLNSLTYSGWCAQHDVDQIQRLIVDLGKFLTLSGISTQGHKVTEDWVTKYNLDYSPDAKNYFKYEELGQEKVITGNQDSNTVVTHWFQPRFHARYIRITPTDWNGKEDNKESKICMRVELYGCQSDLTSYIIQQNPEELCITSDTTQPLNEYPVVRRSECTGDNFMFKYHHRKMQHTKTGLCLTINEKSSFILTRNCSDSKLMFQKVRHSTKEAFLIKDLNGYCARLYENQNDGYLYAIWRVCQDGGFTVLQMSRTGATPFPPRFDTDNIFIETDLFQKITLQCKPYADPFVVYKWTKDQQYSDDVISIETNVVKKSEYSTLTFQNITWDERGTYYCNVWNSEGDAVQSYTVKVKAYQRFDKVPIKQKVIHGRTATFDCISFGIPTPQISWLYTNKKIVTNISSLIEVSEDKYEIFQNGSLSIFDVTYTDEGNYTCVSDSPDLRRNVSAPLDVYVTQSFTTKPVSKHILFGSPTTFDCISEGLPKPSIEWRMKLNKINRVITIDLSYKHQYKMLSNGSLSIKSAMIDDEGEYYCVSTSPGFITNVSAALTVFVTQEFIVTPIDQSILYHQNATFDCESIGIPPPQVSWKIKKLQRLEDISTDNTKYTITESSLIIHKVDYRDEGEYFCISESPRVLKNVSATLRIYVTQQFDIVPMDKKILYGSKHSLACSSIGVPTPAIEWKFKPLKSNDIKTVKDIASSSLFIDNDGILQIVNATMKESGDYICISYSPGLIKNVTAKINVYVTQEFTTKPKSLTLLRDSRATFDCISKGFPTPQVTWRFYDYLNLNKIIPDERYLIFSNNSLVISGVQNKDEGVYICLSESPGLTVNVTASLIVNILPQVSLSSTNGTFIEGQSTTVTCTAAGDPNPNVTWYKIIDGSNQAVTDDNELVLYQLQKKDEGRYICEAINIAGKASMEYLIAVRATCPLDVIQYSVLKSMKFIYFENEQVTIRCKQGFMLEGESRLKCGLDGEWNYETPKCLDLNECLNETKNIQNGSISNNNNVVISKMCGSNSECVNTVGSYKCLCDENYRMVDYKCVYVPPGSETSNPDPVTPGYIPTTPPPQDYAWLQMLIEQYNNELINEEWYLAQLKKLSDSIEILSFDNWKEDALSNTLKALKTAVENGDEIRNVDQKQVINNMQIFLTITDQLLNGEYVNYWQNINKKGNGTVLIMKYLETYLKKKMKVLTLTDFTSKKIYVLENLDITLIPVVSRMESEPLQFHMSANHSQTSVSLPSANYMLVKNSFGIAIMYRTLHRLLPQQLVDDSPTTSSQIFSLSFTSGQTKTLKEPVTIKFKMPEAPITPSCAFWDFNSPSGGSWSTTGCLTVNNSTDQTVVTCQCNHLTNFAVLMPMNTGAKVIYLTFSLTLAIGAGLCIILAFITCMSHVCCSSYSKSDRSTILCNLTFIIIVGLLVFTGAIFVSAMKLIPDSLAAHFCFSLIGCVQLFGVAFFCWIFVEAIQLFFSTRTVIGKGHGHLTLFYFIGWGIPVCILLATGALVYFNKFRLQSKCLFQVSIYLVAILVGAPVSFFIISTLIVYVIIAISMRRNKELLSESVLFHTKRSLIFSFGMIIIHVLVLVAIAFYLHYNPDSLFHHILGGVTAVEGIYLILYHIILDRKKSPSLSALQNSKKRNSYSTKDIVSYSPTMTISEDPTSDNHVDQKYLIKRPSRRSSSESSPYQGHQHLSRDTAPMYGGDLSSPSPEMKPLLSRQASNEMQETIFEEDHDNIITTLPTFSHGTLNKQNSLPRSHNSLPRSYQKRLPVPRDPDESSTDGRKLNRSNSKASSIVSVETHVSGTNQQNGIPVYFPSAPPHYEMSILQQQQKTKEPSTIDSYLEGSTNTSRCTSFGIDSDRMSNISSELSNILYELQAFNTDRHPSEAHDSMYNTQDSNSKTLPKAYRREPGDTDLSSNTSTFKPERRYAKTEVKYDDKKQVNGGGFQEKHRVRVLRGRASRGEADPSDGLHGNSDSIYSSL